MIKNPKRSIAILMAMLLCFSCLSLTVSARWAYIATTGDCLKLNAGGRLHCDGTVEVYSGYTAKVTVEVQRYISGSWETIKSWSDTGPNYASVCEDWYVSSGYQYRLKLTNQALSGGVVKETFIDYSNYVIYD